ncbi:MAG: Gfo/Idh/MocA family oxidoreductase [Planctomycetota bacterium]|nr:Gfo/Idh/MocA family oxidoreductase [Planctomycetota bacterium]
MARRKGRGGIFGSNKRIRLGLWGLGRGMSFYKTCAFLNFDVVAGCDYNGHMRKRFLESCPGAMATDDADRFLAADFDAVLLATYCTSHAEDAIRCLKAGKHVLSEVTAFHTMAEGVRLVEEVEKSGLVYQMAENYPWSAANMYLAEKWKAGLFGELMYAEYEYVHECRKLVYTYIDGVPVQPGNTVHNWRSWLNFHYYNTHSLGPVMIITGTRPVRVVSLLGRQHLAGYPLDRPEGMGGVTPSLIEMDNGGLMRNLMGATTSDAAIRRLWGTRGAAEIVDGKLRLRLGAAGEAPKLEVTPRWNELGRYAAKTGHGGGDFWVLYWFAREILEGKRGPFDIYTSADCTIPGILAYRSSVENGRPCDVPDFRKKADRDRWRNDTFACPRFDVEKGCFPPGADRSKTERFTTIMKDLIQHATAYRAAMDWASVAEDVVEPRKVVEMMDRLIAAYPAMVATMKAARELADAWPESTGARVIREMMALADPEVSLEAGFEKRLKKERARLVRIAERAEKRAGAPEAERRR